MVDNYIKKYNFTYLGMYQALVYFYEIKENPCSEDCVGIIPYCYDESQKELEQKAKDFESEDMPDIADEFHNRAEKIINTIK